MEGNKMGKPDLGDLAWKILTVFKKNGYENQRGWAEVIGLALKQIDNKDFGLRVKITFNYIDADYICLTFEQHPETDLKIHEREHSTPKHIEVMTFLFIKSIVRWRVKLDLPDDLEIGFQEIGGDWEQFRHPLGFFTQFLNTEQSLFPETIPRFFEVLSQRIYKDLIIRQYN